MKKIQVPSLSSSLKMWQRTPLASSSFLHHRNFTYRLQVRTPDNEWKWVKPVPGGITCNAADTLSFLTKGYIKSTIHRVVRPPADQSHLHRLGLFYFVRPGDDVDMVPAPSPVLRREGLLSSLEEDENQKEKPVKGFGKLPSTLNLPPGVQNGLSCW